MFGVNKALLAAAAALVAGAMATPALAQQATSVTGCLAKGEHNSFTISGSDGKSYSLTSTSVKLDQHVGHKVTVTGTSAGTETGALKDTAMAKADTGMKMDTTMGRHAGKKEAGAATGGTLNVTDLKMVSAQCK